MTNTTENATTVATPTASSAPETKRKPRAPAPLSSDVTAAAPAGAPAPTAAPAPATTVDEEPAKRVVVAKHELIDAAGVATDSEEKATGIRYTLLANQQTVDIQTGGAPGAFITMLACFGAKTLATNVTSQERNNPKGEASADEQIAAVRERFQLIATGVWIDRTREGGVKVDKDALAEAICRVLIASGKKTAEEIAAGYKATIRQKIEDTPDYMRTSRQVPQVAVEYAAIVGRVTKTVDDLAI